MRNTTDNKSLPFAIELLNSSLTTEATHVERYLNGRGLKVLPNTLSYVQKHLHSESGLVFPILLASVNFWDGTMKGVHRTFLDPDTSGKASIHNNKKSLGQISGSAVHLAPAGKVLCVGEGIETCLSVQQETGLPCWATLGTSGMTSLILPPLPLASTVIICADPGEPGQKAAEQAARIWTDEGRTVRIATPSDGMDFNEVLMNREKLHVTINTIIESAPVFKSESETKKTIEVYPMSWVMEQEFPPIPWVIPDLLPTGLTLLVGASKLGKSWLMLSIARSVAFGGSSFTGSPSQKAKVLYIALEDSPRRIQARLRKIAMGDDSVTDNLLFAHAMDRLDDAGVEILKNTLIENPGIKLLIIDTLQKSRKVSNGGRETLASDYQALIPMHKLANQLGIAILFVHHTRKDDSGDIFDSISGTTGLMACADTVMVLKRKRDTNDAVLAITGRDVGDSELALRFYTETCTWSMLGNAREVSCTKAEKEILETLRSSPNAMSSKELADELNTTAGAVKEHLRRMVESGKVARVERGKYAPPENPKNTEQHNDPGTAETQAALGFKVQSHKNTSIQNCAVFNNPSNPTNKYDFVTIAPNPAQDEAFGSHADNMTLRDHVTLGEEDRISGFVD